MTNLTTFPMATNAGPKPFIKAGGVGTSAALPTGSPTLVPGLTTALEGGYVYGVFNFQQSSTVATLTELKDSVSLKFSFDGISDLDWEAGTFKVAALNAAGNIITGLVSDKRDDASGAAVGDSSGWADVSVDPASTSGTIFYGDMTPFNPFTGTGVHGIVLAVKTKTDALTEAGEFVKFKIEQSTASGAAFTQSNYTETTIGIKDNVGGVANAGVNVLKNVNFDVGGANPLLNLAHDTRVAGTPDVVDTFNIGVAANASGFSSSTWPTNVDNWSTFYGVDSFGREDVLKIDFKTFKPGLSITTIDAGSAGIENEAYLLNTLRAIDGFQINNSGIYLFQVANSKHFENGAASQLNAAQTADGSTTYNNAGYSTYVFIDSNQNGKVDTNSPSSDDLLIRLAGVAVGDIQSTNFNFVI